MNIEELIRVRDNLNYWTAPVGSDLVLLAHTVATSGFGGLVASMLASGTQDRGYEPGRSRRIFRAKKSTACLPSEGK
jgi:hypothetical protein